MDSLWYGHKYGLVDDEIYDLLWNHCDVRMPNLMTRGGVHHVKHQLNSQLEHIENLQERRTRAVELFHDVVLNGNHKKISDSNECTLAYRKFMMSSSHGLSQGWRDLYIDDYSLFAPVSSVEDQQMAEYMNREDVRKALHVEDSPTKTWPEADVGFDYTKEYDACNWDEDDIVLNISMIDIYKEVVPQLERTWVYNGDTDPCVSYEGTRLAVKQIGIDELDGGGYRPWFYNQTGASMEVLMEKSALFGPNLVAQDMGAQFAGEVVNYEEGLAFVTFHGSGHMVCTAILSIWVWRSTVISIGLTLLAFLSQQVPQFRPQAALAFLKKFISGDMLSPLLPNNATLTDMKPKDFNVVMDAWTEAAMSPPFVEHSEQKVDEDVVSAVAK